MVVGPKKYEFLTVYVKHKQNITHNLEHLYIYTDIYINEISCRLTVGHCT